MSASKQAGKHLDLDVMNCVFACEVYFVALGWDGVVCHTSYFFKASLT